MYVFDKSPADLQITPEQYAVEGFSIQDYGFKFPNRFENSPFFIGPVEVGNANKGLCGGMAAAAACYYKYRVKVPEDKIPPSHEHKPELLEYLKRAQWSTVMSTPAGLLNYAACTIEGSQADRKSVCETLPIIKNRIAKNEPCLLALIRAKMTIFEIGKNIFTGKRDEVLRSFTQHHQVLAYAYQQQADQIILSVYDPAQPSDDNIKLLLRMDDSSIQHIKQISATEFQDLGKVFSIFAVNYNFNEKPPHYPAGLSNQVLPHPYMS